MKSTHLIIKPMNAERHPVNKPFEAGTIQIRSFLLTAVAVALMVASTPAAFGQWEVQDPWVFLEDVLQLQRMGDPALIQSVTGAEQVIQSLMKTGVGIPLAQLQRTADGSSALAYDGNGIYRVLQTTIVTSDGTLQKRSVDDYKKVDAENKAADNFNAVVDDTERRRQQLRAQIKETTVSAQAATTEAEVQKLQSVLAAENSELSAIDNERQAALGRVLVQDAQNRAQESRDSQAKIEDQAANMKAATAKVSQFLTPDSTAAQIPAPNNPAN